MDKPKQPTPAVPPPANPICRHCGLERKAHSITGRCAVLPAGEDRYFEEGDDRPGSVDSALPPPPRHPHRPLPDAKLSHARRCARYMHLRPGDPLRMLAVVVLSVATDDARHGLPVELGAEWVAAAQVEAEDVTNLGIKVWAA